MKKTTLSLLLLLPFGLCAQTAPNVPRLAAIVNLPEAKEKALFEFVGTPSGGPEEIFLEEGQRYEGLTVLNILPDRRAAKVNVDGIQAPLTLTLSGESNSVPGPATTIDLANSSLDFVLGLYGQLSERTLLRWPLLPPARFSLRASPSSQAAAVQVLQKALAEKGLTTIADGERFTMIVPSEHASAVRPHAPKAKPLDNGKPSAEELPPGFIRLHGTEIVHVFEIYSALVGGKFDRAAPRPTPSQRLIFLQTQTSLSKEECVYALDTLFEWQGIKMKRAADGSVRAVQAPSK